jgi:hypothetical protein
LTILHLLAAGALDGVPVYRRTEGGPVFDEDFLPGGGPGLDEDYQSWHDCLAVLLATNRQEALRQLAETSFAAVVRHFPGASRSVKRRSTDPWCAASRRQT